MDPPSPPLPLLLSQENPLDFLLERRLEQLEQKVCLPAVGGIVVQTENHSLHELGGSVLRHLEDQLGQIDGLSLRTIGETEGWERSWRTSDQTSCKGFPDMEKIWPSQGAGSSPYKWGEVGSVPGDGMTQGMEKGKEKASSSGGDGDFLAF